MAYSGRHLKQRLPIGTEGFWQLAKQTRNQWQPMAAYGKKGIKNGK